MGGLDKQTQLDQGTIELAIYRDAFEATIARRVRRRELRRTLSAAPIDPSAGDGWSDVEQIQQQRRRRVMRRYSVANRLTRLLTLTTAGPELEREALRLQIRNLLRRVKRARGCCFPLLWVVEGGVVHSAHTGIRTHVHLLAPRSAAPVIASHATLGEVEVEALRSTDDIRRASNYLAKALPVGTGCQELRTAQSFHPIVDRYQFKSASDAESYAEEMFGGPPDARNVLRLNEAHKVVTAMWSQETVL